MAKSGDVWWLIESETRTREMGVQQYYECGGTETVPEIFWTHDPNKAYPFLTEAEAAQARERLPTIDVMNVASHEWM